MTNNNSEAGGAHFEKLACKLSEVDTRPNDGHMLGMKVKITEAIDHLMRALFPYHFGKSRARFSETEILYAGATVLGGDTKIGDGCVVGGNVWLTHSLDPGVTILSSPGEQSMRKPNEG